MTKTTLTDGSPVTPDHREIDPAMGQALAKTYARQPDFYSGTFCVGCRAHFPVGGNGELVWDGTDEKVGT